MGKKSRREAISYSALSALALTNIAPATAAGPAPTPAAGTIPGRRCIVLGPANALSKAVEDALTAAGGKVTRIEPGDFTEPSWDKALLSGNAGQADVIVNLAVPDAGGAVGEGSPKEFHRIIENSYVRTFLAQKYGIQLLRKSNGGAFITVSTAEGRIGAPGAAARCTVGMGVRMMTQCAALECAAKKDKVRVNAVLVGEIVDRDNVKPGQVGLQDVANAVAYFAADASAYLTGFLLQIDNRGMA